MKRFRFPARLRFSALLLTITPLLLASGCPVNIPGLTGLTVEVINDTDYDVDPNIVFDDDAGFLASVFPSERLSTGVLAPGDRAVFRFDCDQLGSIASDSAQQFLPFSSDAFADDTDVFERDEDFDCNSQIRFRFTGNGGSFGVIVSINGRVVGSR